MARLDRTFGTEVEFYMPQGMSATQCAAAVDSRLQSAGLGQCQDASYGHRPRDYWRLVTDGSLQDYERGREMVSPILRGADGFRAQEVAMQALEDFGCTVNKKCGVHVHVGIGSQSPPIRFLRESVKAYSYFESVIDAAMPPSRRDSSNPFCMSMTRAAFSAIDRAANYGELCYLVTGWHVPRAPERNPSRYGKFNLASLRDYPTVEFRQHSGTLAGAKVNRWINFCLAFVDSVWEGKSVAPVIGQPAPGRTYTGGRVNRARRGSHAWQVGEMLLRPEGVTRQEAMAATGWPSISIPQQAEACGLAVTTSRMGRTTRYFANMGEAAVAAAVEAAPATTTPAPAATLDGLASFIGLDAAESVYFQQRTRDLGGPVRWAA